MKDSARIIIILDRSGSMNTARESTITGFNTFIAEQKKVAGSAQVKLIQFDNEYEVVYDKPLSDVPEMTQSTFVPRGSTALLDAQGRAITELGKELAVLPESDRPNKVIFVTITDGYENSSTDYTRDKVKEMTEHQRNVYRWEFVFLGANQDAIQVGAQMGILRGSSLTYNINNAATYTNAMSAMSASVVASRLGKAVNFTEDDRLAAMTSK